MVEQQNSLDNFNIWHHKPWWCQPWSIILTGITIVGLSWFSFRILWLSLLVAVPIVLWWIYFLLLYPRMIRELERQ